MSKNNEIVSDVQVKNKLGLHTRPATAIVKLLQNCSCEVTFTHKKQTVNAKSILSILMLAARRNSKIKICVKGKDAESVIGRLEDGFINEFGE